MPPFNLPTGRYNCPVCDQRFPELREKKLHLRTEHPRPKRVGQ